MRAAFSFRVLLQMEFLCSFLADVYLVRTHIYCTNIYEYISCAVSVNVLKFMPQPDGEPAMALYGR